MDRQDQQENQPIQETSYNPELQNQANGKECKSLLKGKNRAILIAVALGFIIVNAIVTVAIVSCNKSEKTPKVKSNAEEVTQETSDEKPGYEVDGTVIVRVDKSRKEIVIREGITGIAQGAFSDCSSLERLTIPASMRLIKFGEFSDCVGLERVTLFTDWVNTRALRDVLPKNFNGEIHVIIPDGVRSIREKAFSGYARLVSVTIPKSVTDIGDGAFNCVKNVKLEKGNSCFYQDKSGELIRTLDKTLIYVPSEQTSYNIPNGVKNIAKDVFSGYIELKSITIPNSMTHIGDYAFAGCFITSVTIPDSVTSIGDYAFADCRSLESVTIPDSVTRIGKWAFRGCVGLWTVTLPRNCEYDSSFPTVHRIYRRD